MPRHVFHIAKYASRRENYERSHQVKIIDIQVSINVGTPFMSTYVRKVRCT
jgi:hypothetical protein